jgi:hypothetical protein
MKRKLLFLFVLVCNLHLYSQVGIGTLNPYASSILDLRSSSKGLLIPRLNSVNRISISNPNNGLLVYQSDLINGFYFYDSLRSLWSLIGSKELDDLHDFKYGGLNFDGSIIIGSETTGVLNGAEYNLGFGYKVLESITSGDKNIAIGFNALNKNTDGYFNIGLGNSALFSNSSGYNNTAIGNSALYSNTTGSWNTAIGEEALQYNSTAGWNTAVGFWSLRMNTTGSANVSVGNSSMNANQTGSNNVSIGNAASYLGKTCEYNSVIGAEASYSNVNGSFITALGYKSQYNNLGNNNTSVGASTLLNNISGEENVAMGNTSLKGNVTGSKNTAVGVMALLNNENDENTAIGYSSARGLKSGSRNTFLGSNANTTDTITNSTAIGYGAIVNESNTMQLGDSSVVLVNTHAILKAAGIRTSIKTISSNYNVLVADEFFIVTSSVTIKLPSASKAGSGKVFYFKHMAGNTDTITIQTNGGNIDGTSSWSNLNSKLESVMVVSDGSNYFTFGTSLNQ